MIRSNAHLSVLTPKQRRFVEEYLIDVNATKAAVRAGYSNRTAKEQGAQLLCKAHVREAIDAGKVKRSGKLGLDADRVLEEIAVVAFYDPAELMIDGEADDDTDDAIKIDGRVIYGLRGPADIKRLPETARRAIVGWGYDRNQNFTVKLADKLRALDQLARHLSLYNDKLEVTSLNGLADRLARVKARVNERPPAASASVSASASSALPAPAAPIVPPPSPPAPVAPPPKPYRPIMPAPEPVTWPSVCGQAATDYDPTASDLKAIGPMHGRPLLRYVQQKQ